MTQGCSTRVHLIVQINKLIRYIHLPDYRDGLPPNMRFSRSASYNNPHIMFPSASKLFSGMNSVAGKLATKTAGNSAGVTSVSMTTTTSSISKNSLNTVVEETGIHFMHTVKFGCNELSYEELTFITNR